MLFSAYIPHVLFGEGSIEKLGSIAKKYGKKALLIADPFLLRNGTIKRAEEILEKQGVVCVLFTRVEPNPSCFTVDEAAVIAREEKTRLIIAMGGGSSLDLGKAVAMMAINEGKSWDYTLRSDHEMRTPNGILPIVAIPTTAGTGSETTPFSVLNNPEIMEKSTIVNDLLYPLKAIVDPDLTYTMPPKLTASTGFDAFAHALESYISLKATPFTRMVAGEALRLSSTYLPRSVVDGTDKEARAKMAWAAVLGGTAISTIGVTMPHALGQPVGGLVGAPHGESVAACTVEILRRSAPHAINAFAEVADILNPGLSHLPAAKRAGALADMVARFLIDIGLTVRFSDFGFSEKDIDKAVTIAFTGYYFDMNCHPASMTRDQVRDIYRTCL